MNDMRQASSNDRMGLGTAVWQCTSEIFDLTFLRDDYIVDDKIISGESISYHNKIYDFLDNYMFGDEVRTDDDNNNNRNNL